MEKKHFEILLGFTKEHGVISGDVTYYPDGTFTASFNESLPEVINMERAKEYVEDMIENMDSNTRLSKLEYYDCAPSDLANSILQDDDMSIEDLFDNSLHSDSFEMNEDDTVYLMASGCGQHDTRGYIVKYINEELYHEIHYLWDTYHLEKVDYNIVKDVFDKIEKQYHSFDEYDAIEKEVEEFYAEVKE